MFKKKRDSIRPPKIGVVFFCQIITSYYSCKANELLDSQLEIVGKQLGWRFTRVETPGDGSCQFAAIAQALSAVRPVPNMSPDDVRAAAVAWLRTDPELPNDTRISHFAENRVPNWEAYCNEMARSGTWGNHLTLVAANNALGVIIQYLFVG